MNHTTIEPSAGNIIERGALSRERQLETHPRLTILFHPDLSRIGAMTPPELFAESRWLDFGRLSPEFVAPVPEIVSGPLEDPHVSRRQFKLRWTGENFELSPLGKQPISLVELAPGQPDLFLQTLKGPTLLRPGALVAIGKQILLRFSLEPWNPPEADRHGMVGETEALWGVRRAIEQVVQFGKPALIQGPTGAGKELVARALHALSDRARGPFLPINCAALPEHLVESLLFGHKKGAFTGADGNQDGAFVGAEGGSLFLDEIGELPLGIQSKLLRVLQERTVTPVGSHKARAVDVRLMAATHRNLEEDVKANTLRADFYYRIAVHPIDLPSLKTRCWDVPQLFVHFLRRNRDKLPALDWLWGGSENFKPVIPMGFFLDLMRHPWDGNIRELQNIVEQASRHNLAGAPFTAAFFYKAPAPTSVQRMSALAPARKPLKTTPAKTAPPSPSGPAQASQNKALSYLGVSRKIAARLSPGGVPSLKEDEDFDSYAERVEHALADALLDLFEEYTSNQVRIAEHLGISRNTLIRLMKIFCIPRARDIDADELAAIKKDTGGDIAAIADHFGISERAMALFLSHSAL